MTCFPPFDGAPTRGCCILSETKWFALEKQSSATLGLLGVCVAGPDPIEMFCGSEILKIVCADALGDFEIVCAIALGDSAKIGCAIALLGDL